MHGFTYHQNTSDSCKDDSNLWYLLCITLVVVLLFQETERYLLKNQITLS